MNACLPSNMELGSCCFISVLTQIASPRIAAGLATVHPCSPQHGAPWNPQQGLDGAGLASCCRCCAAALGVAQVTRDGSHPPHGFVSPELPLRRKK